MTRRAGRSTENDPGLKALLEPRTPAVCIVGKTWDFHAHVALGVELDENIAMIGDSIVHANRQTEEVIFDAEHFFDGYKANPEFALSCIRAAYEAGARWIVLCDTNGGTLPHEVSRSLLKSPTTYRGLILAFIYTMTRATPWPTA